MKIDPVNSQYKKEFPFVTSLREIEGKSMYDEKSTFGICLYGFFFNSRSIKSRNITSYPFFCLFVSVCGSHLTVLRGRSWGGSGDDMLCWVLNMGQPLQSKYLKPCTVFVVP